MSRKRKIVLLTLDDSLFFKSSEDVTTLQAARFLDSKGALRILIDTPLLEYIPSILLGNQTATQLRDFLNDYLSQQGVDL